MEQLYERPRSAKGQDGTVAPITPSASSNHPAQPELLFPASSMKMHEMLFSFTFFFNFTL